MDKEGILFNVCDMELSKVEYENRNFIILDHYFLVYFKILKNFPIFLLF